MQWLVLLLVIYAAWCAALYAWQDRMMFPLGMLEPAMATPPAGAEPIVLERQEGDRPVRVEALYYAPAPPTPAPLLVFFHGNAETADHALGLANDWRARGFAVLLIEYRGYGRSTGTPGEKHLVADALAFIEAVAPRPEIDRSRVVLHARSLGAGVAAQVAAALVSNGTAAPATIRAVIIQSTFSSVPRLVARMLAPPFLIRNTFRTDRALSRAGLPVLILHGVDDEIIPVSHARRLHRVIPGSTLVELPGHHNDFPVDEAAYWAAIDRFLDAHGPAPTP